jgi:hypothetical protein
MFDRMRDTLFGKKHDEPVTIRVTETPADLQRGDVIVFWEGGDALVTATLDCWEDRDGRQDRWRWLFLSSGQVLETVGRTTTIYERGQVIERASVAFQRLTGSPEQDGVLQSFEARLRDGTSATDPVVFRMDDRAYRVQSTGTFLATRTGPLDLDVWRDISATAGQNVYFRMQSSEGEQVLGVWTADIALLTGRPLLSSEIKGLYGA